MSDLSSSLKVSRLFLPLLSNAERNRATKLPVKKHGLVQSTPWRYNTV